MKEKNEKRLDLAVSAGFPEDKLQNVCRAILKDEISGYAIDSKMLDFVSEAIDMINIPLDKSNVGGNKSHDFYFGKYATFIVALSSSALCWILTAVIASGFWGWILSAAISVTAIFFVSKKMDQVKKSPLSYCSVDDIRTVLDKIVSCFGDILKTGKNDSPIAGPVRNDNIPFLEQDPYKYLLDQVLDDLQDAVKPWDVDRLTEIIESCGYQLIEYSAENGILFDKSSANIPEPKTTVKAVINKNTKNCIRIGKVVFPNH